MTNDRDPRNTGTDEEELEPLDRAARRLHQRLHTFLTDLPARLQSGSELSRELKVERATCQRILSSALGAYEGLEIVGRLPGRKGIENFVKALGRQSEWIDAGQLQHLSVAADSFADALRETAGSQAAFVKRWRSRHRETHQDPALLAEDDQALKRRSFFEASAEITGHVCETSLLVLAINEDPHDPDNVRLATAKGTIGHRTEPDAAPLLMNEVVEGSSRTGPEGEPKPASMELSGFSSESVRMVNQDKGPASLSQFIETVGPSQDKPVDILLSSRGSFPHMHPALIDSQAMNITYRVPFPSRYLLLDIYLSRRLAQSCLPSAKTYLGGEPQEIVSRALDWGARFREDPDLVLLGQGTIKAHSRAYANQKGLTDDLFHRQSWDPADFVGFRLQVHYPIWKGTYCLRLDFSGMQHPSS
ncbi:MAG: hypothetical protein KDC14_05140 [Planctomycetes bacterium]|nr:hypothetical protein [Planctomycetota bacterium]